MLEHRLGPQRFWAGIHEYLTRHAFGVATSDDLRQAFLAATGENLDRFWSEWIYQAGYPKFDVAATYDSASHALTLRIRQTQLDSLKPDSTGLKFTVPAVFHAAVVVRVGTAAGDVTQRVELDAREQTVTFQGLAGAPTMVIFDDGDLVLKGLTFPQPTAWLATELARDDDLWDRTWAIEQLADRKDDSAAAAALADAAARADYFQTRAEAAGALGAFPAALALPALEAALRDTSAAVRSAALESLGELGGERAAALAKDAFAHDSSYEVQAAAVTALGRADAGHADAIVTEALRDSSYQDVIQTAALRLIAVSNDTARLGTLDSLERTTQNAAFVLAAMGARGNAHALDLLAAHLDDASAAARRWALQAFRYGMPQPLALAHLRAAADHLTRGDARAAVADAIKQMGADRGDQ
jgi:aminopeptidase N